MKNIALLCLLFMFLIGCEIKEASKLSLDKAKVACDAKADVIWANSGITGVYGTPLDKMEVVRFSERDRDNSLAYDIQAYYKFDNNAGEYANKEIAYLCTVLINGDKVVITGDGLNWIKANKK